MHMLLWCLARLGGFTVSPNWTHAPSRGQQEASGWAAGRKQVFRGTQPRLEPVLGFLLGMAGRGEQFRID